MLFVQLAYKAKKRIVLAKGKKKSLSEINRKGNILIEFC